MSAACIFLLKGKVAVALTCRNYPKHPRLAAEDLLFPAGVLLHDDARQSFDYSHPRAYPLAPAALAVL